MKCLGPWLHQNALGPHAHVLPWLCSPQKGDSRAFNHKFLGWLSLLVCGICFLIVFTFLCVGWEFRFVCDERSKLSPKLIQCSRMFLAPSHKRTATHIYQVLCNFNGIKLIYKTLCDVFLLSHPIFLLLFFQLFCLLNTYFQIKKEKKKLSESSEIKEFIICKHASLFSWYFEFCLPERCILTLTKALHRCVDNNLSHTVVCVQITYRKLSAVKADKTQPEIAGFHDRESLQLSKQHK